MCVHIIIIIIIIKGYLKMIKLNEKIQYIIINNRNQNKNKIKLN